jgi:hypothetical protein
VQRLRISSFQVAILRLVRDSEYDGCAPTSPHSKRALFGRPRRLSTAQRVTLHRSVRRLIANGMLHDNGRGWCRLTDKARAWLLEQRL